jgi:hypothetical protein
MNKSRSRSNDPPGRVLFAAAVVAPAASAWLGIDCFAPAIAPGSPVQADGWSLAAGTAGGEGGDCALGYLMDHSAAIRLIDPQVRYTAIFSGPQDPKAMAADFAAIRKSRATSL